MASPSVRSFALALLVALLAAAPAAATWSIVAVDPETREVGAAGASCILGSQVIAEIVPDRGVAVAQAFTNPEAGPKLRAALAAGQTAAAAVSTVTSRWFDSFVGASISNLRQYGVATLASADAPANFTGRWTMSWSGALAAPGVSVQGNSLRGPQVVQHALEAFQAEGRGCQPTLADRLIAGLAAGSAAGGDRRCAAELSALSAFLFVAGPEDAPGQLRLQLVRNRPGEPPWTPWRELRNAMRPQPGTVAENPVRLLEASYQAWLADSGSAPRCAPHERGPRPRTR